MIVAGLRLKSKFMNSERSHILRSVRVMNLLFKNGSLYLTILLTTDPFYYGHQGRKESDSELIGVCNPELLI
jgi:hypothetical protein